MTELDRPTLFEPARRQARAVLAERLAAPPPLRLPSRAMPPSRWMLACALAAVCVLSVSGAWAFMHRARMPVLSVPGQIADTTTPLVGGTRPVAVPVVAQPVVPAASPHVRKRSKVHASAARAPDQVRFDDEPLGDVIFVRTPSVQPPLFNVDEYKSRGVLVH